MKEGTRLLRNIGSNYVQDVLLMGISLVLNPFMYRRLGASAYGVIALTGATTGLLRLLDIGLAHAVARHVSRSATLDDKEEVNRVVTTAMVVYAILGFVALLAVSFLGFFCLEALGVPEAERPAARWVFLLAGVSLAIRFPGNALEGALRGLQRFELANAATLADRIVYAVSVALVLAWFGWGLAAVGVCLLVGSIAAQLTRWVSVVTAYRSLRMGSAWISTKTAREMLGFGTLASLTQISSFIEQTIFRFLLSAALGSAVLGAFNLVMTVVSLLPQLVIGITSVIMPAASRYQAEDDLARLQRLLLDGSRLVLAVSLPAVVWVVVMAQPILETWVEPEMAQWGALLQWMMIVLAADQLCGSGNMVLMGIGRVRAMGTAYAASSVLAGGVLCALLWGTSMGVYGVPVALGVGIVIRRVVVLVQMCRGVEVRVGRYVLGVLVPSVGCAVLTGALVVVARDCFFRPGWGNLIASVLVTGVIHASATWMIVLSRAQRAAALTWLRVGRTSRAERVGRLR